MERRRKRTGWPIIVVKGALRSGNRKGPAKIYFRRAYEVVPPFHALLNELSFHLWTMVFVLPLHSIWPVTNRLYLPPVDDVLLSSLTLGAVHHCIIVAEGNFSLAKENQTSVQRKVLFLLPAPCPSCSIFWINHFQEPLI